ncbi:MAG: OB-fold domain-containing protein [Haloferacaceae archaeon]|mgnify:CR=1 FL=1|jgi:hypothetical protein|nr:OB-fold domain-containing protein [Haloferacaceae archaeon]
MSGEEPAAARYADGSVGYPAHPIGPDGDAATGEVSLADAVGTVETWTRSTAPPPGVRAPNLLAIVSFDVTGGPVRMIGQVDAEAIAIGDRVRLGPPTELRDPAAALRPAAVQSYTGHRFVPVED